MWIGPGRAWAGVVEMSTATRANADTADLRRERRTLPIGAGCYAPCRFDTTLEVSVRDQWAERSANISTMAAWSIVGRPS